MDSYVFFREGIRYSDDPFIELFLRFARGRRYIPIYCYAFISNINKYGRAEFACN